ncbi:MAG: hypothetical protein HUK16_04910 [Bacteroidales bacterium]|nr:hypothetical protein [Bacteroidales bacterium]
MITEKATYYLVYAALVAVTFFADQLLKKTDKRNRTIGYVVSLVADFAILGFGLYLYFVKGEDQTGFVFGGLIFLLCILCLLGRFWQNKEQDKRRKSKGE